MWLPQADTKSMPSIWMRSRSSVMPCRLGRPETPPAPCTLKPGRLRSKLELSLLALRPACKLSASTLLEPTVGVVFSALTVTACSVLSCAIAAKGRAMMRAHKGRSAGARER